ncbi:ABC transporter ATP-binding protein [Marivirga lumbricoides]|uniref:ABC transporter ATP-binding protein n=1 Tax=Marivirga lumbricoides TaxID=1046115 RepID=A0ABQ1M9Y7_9BACT|nr:ABC transporter ATP-binding protein [Marivirga lumbricoides]
MSSILLVNHVTKVYQSGNKSLTVLNDISFEIKPGSSVAIVGPSGSGKTTLLGLCAGLDGASSGNIVLNGQSLDSLSEDERAAIRNKHVGFIFQSFNLLPTLTALENVMVPLELLGMKNVKPQAIDLLEKVGLKERINHYPTQLSGGEQQRVSIARAFANQPKVLFADEPTGNLDEETGAKIEDLIFNLNKELGTTLVMVTHDGELANKTNRILKLKGGKLAEDTQQEASLSNS